MVTPPPPLPPAEISSGSPRILRALPIGAPPPAGTTFVRGRREPLEAEAASRTPRNTTSSSDGHGEFWPVLNNTDGSGAAVTGASATQAVYPNYIFGHVALYAPTLRAPDPDSLEIGIVYKPDHGAFVGTWDWASAKCQNAWCVSKDLTNPAVQSSYVRTFRAPNGDTFQGVTVQTVADQGGIYHAYIYNYSAAANEELLNDGPYALDSRGGWDMFEYYNGPSGSPCLALPGSVYSIDANVFSNGTWRPVDPSNSHTQYGRDAGCFDAPYQPVFYGATVLAANYAWEVAVNPTPAPTPTPAAAWHVLQGSASSIGAGPGFDPIVVGSNPLGPPGNFALFQWVGSAASGSFSRQLNGYAWKVAVSPEGTLWALTADHQISRSNGAGGYDVLPGSAREISVTTNGTAYVVGDDPVGPAGNYGIHRWNGTTWVQVVGYASKVSVSSDGLLWAITADLQISRANSSGGYDVLPGAAYAIAAAPHGMAYVIGTSPTGPGGYQIYQYTGTTWVAVPGGYGVAIAVSPDGSTVYSLGSDSSIRAYY
ncbi:MAG: hypothetical protein M3169_04420 [Candidatus Eremiobacteraeota bacterium]|nr:hypothetical protein [Candidatus Eremiobacteraeota bacterium]